MFTKKKQKEVKEAFEKGKEDFSETQIAQVIGKEESLEKRFKKDKNLSKYFSDFKLLFSLLKDYFSGRYRKIPWNMIAAIGGTLLYVLSPLDVIADVIPFIGFVDDAAVFGFCLKMVSDELEEYRVWKSLNETS